MDNIHYPMTFAEIAITRLLNQQIAKTEFRTPQEIVSWLGAMQAQEYAMAKWALGLRLKALNDAHIEAAFNSGAILRTHVLRPTWHFVTPMDIRWMLALTAPRVLAFSASMFRKLELDNAIFKRGNDTLAKALHGGRQLTRAHLKTALERSRVVADGLRLGYLLMHAELDGIICSGARQGKQFTYALLDERAPGSKTLDKEEALAKLTNIYFTSRGPATLQDFAWWSGLTMKEVRTGIAMQKGHLVQRSINGREYVFTPPISNQKLPSITSAQLQTTFLLPDYDEYGIAYRDRTALFTAPLRPPANAGSTNSHVMVIDGVIGGVWQRKINKNTIVVETKPLSALNKRKHQAMMNAVARYTAFANNIAKR